MLTFVDSARVRAREGAWRGVVGGLVQQAQRLLHRAAEHLAQGDVHLLNAGGGAGGDEDQGGGEAVQVAAVAAGEGRRQEAHLPRLFQRRDDVAAAARGGNRDGEVAGAAQGFDLAGEEAAASWPR